MLEAVDGSLLAPLPVVPVGTLLANSDTNVLAALAIADAVDGGVWEDPEDEPGWDMFGIFMKDAPVSVMWNSPEPASYLKLTTGMYLYICVRSVCRGNVMGITDIQ